MLFRLTEELIFPHPSYANEDGLLAVGGDLTPERIIVAYQNGIFPWFNEGEPILWWSPNPRCVLFPAQLKVSKSMRYLFRKNAFTVTFNSNFEAVIDNCATINRKNQNGTWITNDIKKVYTHLHQKNIAHSVEVWDKENRLVGGLYGLLINNVFFGESMFAKKSNASKYGFITFVQHLEKKGVKLIDCQTTTKHLLSMGAEEIDCDLFLQLIA